MVPGIIEKADDNPNNDDEVVAQSEPAFTIPISQKTNKLSFINNKNSNSSGQQILVARKQAQPYTQNKVELIETDDSDIFNIEINNLLDDNLKLISKKKHRNELENEFVDLTPPTKKIKQDLPLQQNNKTEVKEYNITYDEFEKDIKLKGKLIGIKLIPPKNFPDVFLNQVFNKIKLENLHR